MHAGSHGPGDGPQGSRWACLQSAGWPLGDRIPRQLRKTSTCVKELPAALADCTAALRICDVLGVLWLPFGYACGLSFFQGIDADAVKLSLHHNRALILLKQELRAQAM